MANAVETPAKNPRLMPAWEPGKSGNPRGRPKGPSLTKALYDEFRRARDGKSSRTIQSVVQAIIDAACKGDMKAAAMIWDRVDGKVAEHILTEAGQQILVRRDDPDVPREELQDATD